MITITKTGAPSGLIILGLMFFVTGALMMFQNAKETSWQAVQGVVINSDIVREEKTLTGNTTSAKSWYLQVTYEYTLDGVTYQNNEISSAPLNSNASGDTPPSKKLVALSKRFVSGEAVTVYVSPKNPNKSILLHAPNYGIWGVLIGFLFFAGASYWSRLRAGS
ncbi:DUF3592 domain-containing protein [Hellea sp.]|nr:DUF3592 domain-containing protein [Hellea sp.]